MYSFSLAELFLFYKNKKVHKIQCQWAWSSSLRAWTERKNGRRLDSRPLCPTDDLGHGLLRPRTRGCQALRPGPVPTPPALPLAFLALQPVDNRLWDFSTSIITSQYLMIHLFIHVSIKLVSIFLENPNTNLGTRTGVTGTNLVSGHILDFQSGLPWYCRDEREQHLLKTSRVFWYLLFMGQKIEWWASVREQSPCCDGLMN